jgi:Carboxypeptidase regulatory-like domain
MSEHKAALSFSLAIRGFCVAGRDKLGECLLIRERVGRAKYLKVRWHLALVLLFAAPLLTPTAARAQAVWGSIQGYVTDPSGSAIPRATVRATEERTGVVTQAVTNPSGFYDVTHIVPGTYAVSVETSGFKHFIQRGVLLSVGATVRLDVKLQLGSVHQSVTVTAASPILNTEQTNVSTGFTSGQVEALPILQNNVTNLTDLVPGALKDTFEMGVGENPQNTNRVWVNGTFSGAQTYTLDGITDVDYGFSGIQVINPPQDSVQEEKVSTGSYDTEFGSTAGMVMQLVTKSGTNQLHGSAYEDNLNSSTFAADPFADKIAGTGPEGKGIGVQPSNWNDFGASLGGPVKKNKVFLFGDYYGTRTAATTGLVTTVPNASWRNGDLSSDAATYPIYNPATGTSSGTGRSLFPDDIIPTAMISPVATKLLDLLPLPNVNQTPNNNYDGTVHEIFNTNEFDLRNDWNISDKDRFFATYHYDKTSLTNPGIFGLTADGPTTGGLSPEVANTLSQQAALNYTHTFSPTLIGEFRAGFDRFDINAYQYDHSEATDNEVGITGINNPANPLTMGLAGITVDGPDGAFSEGIVSGVGIPRFEGSTTFEAVNNWTKMWGKHQFQWGVDVQRQDFNFLSVNDSSRGNFEFSESVTASPGVANSGLGMATFLFGRSFRV